MDLGGAIAAGLTNDLHLICVNLNTKLDERLTMGLYPYCMASKTDARTHPLVLTPQTTTVSTPRTCSRVLKSVPKKALGYFFAMTASPSIGVSPAASTQPPNPRPSPRWKMSSDLLLSQNIPASRMSGCSYSTRVQMMGTPPERAASRRRFMDAGEAALAGLLEVSSGEDGAQYALHASTMRRAGRAPHPIFLENPERAYEAASA